MRSHFLHSLLDRGLHVVSFYVMLIPVEGFFLPSMHHYYSL